MPRSLMRPSGADLGPPHAVLLADVEAGGDRRTAPGRRDQQRGQTPGLVGGEGVHRVEDERLGPGHAGAVRANTVVEDRVQERLGLARAGAGRDQRRQRPRLGRSEVDRRQPPVCLGLMTVGRSGRDPSRGSPAIPRPPGGREVEARRYGPLNMPSCGSSRNSLSACAASGSASAKVVVR